MQMQIGTFVFQLGAEYEQAAWTWRRRWTPRQRRGLPPLFDDLGRDADTVRLRGTVVVTAGDHLDALAPLRSEAGMGRAAGAAEPEPAPGPLPVYLGGSPGASGEYIGDWVVSRITERHRDLRTAAGIPARIEFEVEMSEAAASGAAPAEAAP